jgi:hypothetical protein
MTEKEKMLAGEIYSAVDPQLIEELTEVKEIISQFSRRNSFPGFCHRKQNKGPSAKIRILVETSK